MLFADQPERWKGWRIDILGTDISGRAVAAAKNGAYTQFEIQRGLGVTQMLRWFTETGEGWRPRPELRRPIRFERRNVLDAPPDPGCFDLVLCRNVLLYFAPANRARAGTAGRSDRKRWLADDRRGRDGERPLAVVRAGVRHERPLPAYRASSPRGRARFERVNFRLAVR
jgi:hypothetical protein